MLLTRKFIATIHPEFGKLGWLAENAPKNFEALGPMTVVHDFLEHNPEPDGSPEEEARAFGATIFVRALGGYFNQGMNPEPAHHLSADIVHFTQEGIILNSSPHTKALQDEEAEEIIGRVVQKSVSDIFREMPGEKNLGKLVKSIRHWRGYMRQGFRAAAKKYRNFHPGELARIFREMEEKIRETEEAGVEEKDQLQISFNLETKKWRIIRTAWYETEEFAHLLADLAD